MNEYSSVKYIPVAAGKDKIKIGGDLVNFHNDRKTYKEYLANRFAPRYKNKKGQEVKMVEPVKILASAIETSKKLDWADGAWERTNMDSARTLFGFKKFNPVKQKNVSFYVWVDGRDTEMGISGSDFNRRKKRSEYPRGFKFPKHLGRNNDSYKDLKEYHPGENFIEKRLRIRSYAKKRREENRIYYTKKISSIIARITSLPRKLIKLTLYVIRKLFELTLYVIRKLFELTLYVIKRPIVLTFENILYAIKTNSAHELVFKLLLFPFFLVNHISATGKLPTFTEIKESERYYYLAFRGLVRTVVYITLFAAIIYYVVSA
ncbi:hypothetical protein N9X70_03180 [Gammaproteobacteria bacterium]|nr:hypothetical protein [Gammaproteobacteria bacterium]